MKLTRIRIENFKGIRALDLSLEGATGPRPLTCLVGDNGAGKTTVLQAVALVISLATRHTTFPAELSWHGFLAERVSSLGETRVELEVVLDREEVALTQDLFVEWRDSLPGERRQSQPIVPPDTLGRLNLIYESGKVSCRQGSAAFFQFLGRYYVRQLIRTRPTLRENFHKLGDVFWFDQFRNLGSPRLARSNDDNGDANLPSESWTAGVEQLRKFLIGWWAVHKSPERGAGKDYIDELEIKFAQIFPGTHFRGVLQRDNVAAPGSEDFYFLLEQAGKVYDLAEMSSGEQAVFPLIYEFVRLDIARSIVLIDELELHLHPPQQQALLAALRRIGPDCQFIITTHSPFLEDVIPEDDIYRLAGGKLCP